MEKFIKIDIQINTQEEAEIYVSGLSDINFYAFEQNEQFLIAYIKQNNFNEERFNEIIQKDTAYNFTLIENKNWNEQWERDLQPVYINNFAGIRASFHQPLQNIKHEIIVTSKMSFGTGHHATTHLMIEQMETIDLKNKNVLDFGTGTGVLAILAEKLGASKIVAIDNDEWSINNANENVQMNNCKKITVQYNNDLANLDTQDIILANINLNVLINNGNKISSIMRPGGLLLMSGFFVEYEDTILNIYTPFNFIKREEKQIDNWISLLLYKQLF